MNKIILKTLCAISLVLCTVNAHGMPRLSQLMHQGLDRGLVLLKTAQERLKPLADKAALEAGHAYHRLAELANSAAGMAIKGARSSKILAETAYRASLTLIKNNPKKTAVLGASLAAFFIARNPSVRRAAHIIKQFLIYQLLCSHNRHLVSLAAQKFGADVDHRFQDNKTALHLAAEQGRADIIDCLRSNGANISLHDAQGLRPIHRAALNGHIEVVEHLVHYGENIDVFSNGDNGNSRATPLQIASVMGQLQMARWLVQHGANDQSKAIDNNLTAQEIAAAGRHENVAQYLAQIRPGPTDHWFTQVLQSAITDQDAQRARLAINSGAHMVDTNVARMPLFLAIVKQETQITPLDQIAEALVKAGVPIHSTDAEGNTPLLLAATRQNARIARMLLERGADVNAQNAAGETVLTIALKTRNIGLVDALKDNGIHLTAEQKQANPWLNEAEHPAQ